MTQHSDPIQLSTEIVNRYRRYLQTMFYFRDPELRQSFIEALHSESMPLSKGPILEASPPFKRGLTVGALIDEFFQPDPDGELEKLKQALFKDRELYVHQEKAIRKVIGQDRNILVATGTGSGKTESFLYPIILHLYREFLSNELEIPGVRALILYPMNALVNDQRERLGEICKRLKNSGAKFKFTFGQYIGETPNNPDDYKKNAQDFMDQKFEGELLFRDQMRNKPPHILITNYSMLEYMLIRPKDSPFFDNGSASRWKFIVIDEAHQYRGTKGMEMGMLIRRLKQRLREGGKEGKFVCIATSATIASGNNYKKDVARFADNLFGEGFGQDDIIFGEREQLFDQASNATTTELTWEDYKYLHDIIRKGGESSITPSNELQSIKIPPGLSEHERVGHILLQDQRALKLLRLISGQDSNIKQDSNKSPYSNRDVHQLIKHPIFDDLSDVESKLTALSTLVELLTIAKRPYQNSPIITARYHLFLRSLEGAFINYLPKKHISLTRLSDSGKGKSFEIALCRDCGQHYIVGRISGSFLRESIRDPGEPDFGTKFFLPLDNSDDTDEYIMTPQENTSSNTQLEIKKLCVECGKINNGDTDKLDCGHKSYIHIKRLKQPDEKSDQLSKCPVCEYRGNDPVREVIHGSDGPHAVIATTLHQKLPKDRKKILIFADGRQEAAFFAWYLEKSYREIISRNVINKIISNIEDYPSDGVSLKSLADRAYNNYKGFFTESKTDDNLTIRKNIWKSLYREFLYSVTRFSLEGVGLIRWDFDLMKDGNLKIPDILFRDPWSLSEKKAMELIKILFYYTRIGRAVELRTPLEISLNWDDLNIPYPQTSLYIGKPNKKRNVTNWEGLTTSRGRFLIKYLLSKHSMSRDKAKRHAQELLKSIWNAIIDHDKHYKSNDKFLIDIHSSKRLNPFWWRVYPIFEDETIYQCTTCYNIQYLNIDNLCIRHNCPGTVQPIKAHDLTTNHYRILYKEDLPEQLKVEEHTAQLSKERAREVQNDFKKGHIHALSCSTTFELGVDLGDLDTVFLRNVPPEPFNYMQRVGRAGRRSGHPGFSITYCKRSPHDLYHFINPEERIIEGNIMPPRLSYNNEKIITRHITAVALSFFFREYPERFHNVESFFVNLEKPQALRDLYSFLDEKKNTIQKSIKSVFKDRLFDFKDTYESPMVISADLQKQLGLHNDQWIDKITCGNSQLAKGEIEIMNDYSDVKKLKEDAKERDDFKTAHWANKRLNTIANEDVLSFLSRKAIIPKYGFPVDVVELDLHKTYHSVSQAVDLQRDLSIAISEYAPTSKVIANKQEWQSYGIKKVVQKESPIKEYYLCRKHNLLISSNLGKNGVKDKCCDDFKKRGKYLIPQFGFITATHKKPSPPSRRPYKLFSTRPYFMGFEDGQSQRQIIEFNGFELTGARPGKMVVICEGRKGRGFLICKKCGAGFTSYVPEHKTPFGYSCDGKLERLCLAHEFVTDVLSINFPLPTHKINTSAPGFAYSLAYALLEGTANVLDVPSTDLAVTVSYSSGSKIPPIVLYDNVPGGAGLVQQLEDQEVFLKCLKAAYNRVDGRCNCGYNESCYGCLRSYQNQFVHPYLTRGPIKDYLENILKELKVL